jgi:hypothetical protein
MLNNHFSKGRIVVELGTKQISNMKKLALFIIFGTICIAAMSQDVSKSKKSKSNSSAKNIKFWLAEANPKAVYRVVGLVKDAVVLENEEGEKILLKDNNTITSVPDDYIIPPLKLKPPKVYKLMGNDESGTPVWDNGNGKGCTLNMQGGERVRTGFITVCK